MGRAEFLRRRLLGLLITPSDSGVSLPPNGVKVILTNDSHGGFPLYPKSRWTDTAAINHSQKPRLYVHRSFVN